MDLALLARVLWRHRIIVGVGLFAAIALAFLSLVRVGLGGSGPKLQYRQHEEWQSLATLFVSQRGFPYGRAVIPDGQDPSRFGNYATLYAHLAMSDAVKRLILRGGPIDASHEFMGAAPVLANPGDSSSPPLPLIDLWAISDPPQRAEALTRRATAAFMQYLDEVQQANKIPLDQRVVVTVVSAGNEPLLLKKRSKTLAVVIFLTVAMATCGLAFIVENVKRRRRQAEASELPAEPARRSA